MISVSAVDIPLELSAIDGVVVVSRKEIAPVAVVAGSTMVVSNGGVVNSGVVIPVELIPFVDW